MSDFLEKHGINLEKPQITSEVSSFSAPKREKQSIFTFSDGIHFARFIISNQDELKDFAADLMPVHHYTRSYNAACCGESKKTWKTLLNNFTYQFIVNSIQKHPSFLPKIKSILKVEKILIKKEGAEFIF